MLTKKAIYVLGGVFVIVLAAVIFISLKGQSLNLGFKPTIESENANAFGKLSLETASAPATQETALGLGGGANTSAVAPRVAGSKDMVAASGVVSATDAGFAMPSPYYMNYSYKFDGEVIDINGIDLPVLKRNKTNDMSSKVSGILGKYNFGSVDLSRFGNLQANNISLVEEAEDGYSIYLNLVDGQVSIDKNRANYAIMATDASVKTNIAMPERPIQDIKEVDIPADDVLIAIADKFLEKYKIDKSAYGAPRVDISWKNQILTMKAEGQTIYAPQFVSVIYPLEINGTPVYEEYGSRAGLYVTVDVTNQVVQSVSNLYTQNYTSSKYDLENNLERIIKIAENGGLRGRYNYGDAKTQELKLGTPKVIYIKKYSYINGIGEEILVPGLLFEVKDAPQTGYFYSTDVMVPLVKDMLDDLEKGGSADDGGPIRILPMPAPEPAILEGSGSSAGSSGSAQ